MAIWFHSEYPGYQVSQKRILKRWINSVIIQVGYRTGEINYIFSDDNKILEVNRNFLNHNFYTDIISFDYSNDKFISGDIYISIDRVKENAIDFNEDFNHELQRVLIHGVLHFLGYKDKTKIEINVMRKAETRCLESLKLS